MTVCPLSPPRHDLDCEYCSDESYMQIRDACNILTHRKVMIKKVEHRGLLCNNAPVGKSPWVVDQKVCPKTIPITKELKMPVPGKAKVPDKSNDKRKAGTTKKQPKKKQSYADMWVSAIKQMSENMRKEKKGPSRKRGGQQTLGDVIEI